MKNGIAIEKKSPLFTLSPLPYAYDALKPAIDETTMRIHHTKHHQAYIDNLNKALEGYPALQGLSLFQLLTDTAQIPESIRTVVTNNAGGHANHSFFWQCMSPNGGGEPTGDLAKAIEEAFGTVSAFCEQFTAAAKSCFGSGWAWLVQDQTGTLKIISTANQNSPLSGGYTPLLGLDLWEHAYYLHYQNRRTDYIKAWWNIVNWDFVASQYKK